MIKKYIKKETLIILFTVILVMVSFSSCSKGKNDKKNDDTPEYVYEADFREFGSVNVDNISKACITNEGIYMTAPYYKYDDEERVETTINYFMSCHTDDNNIETTEIKGLKNNEYIEDFFTDENGNMLFLTSVSYYNEKTDVTKSDYYMINVDKHGKLSRRIRLMPDSDNSEEFYFNNAVYTGGRLLIGSENKIYTFNKDGSTGKSIEVENYIDYMFASDNEKIYIMSYVDGKNGIRELNMETGKLGEALKYDGNEMQNIDHAKQLGDNVYLSNNNGMFKCDFKKNRLEFLFDWINVDINSYNVVDFLPMEDESITVLCSETDFTSMENGQNSSDIEIVSINKKKYEEVKPKKILKFATYSMDETVKKELLKFNRTSKDYHIEVISYSSYDDPQKQMNLDIITGNIPDIMEVGYLPKEIYIKRGILADLYSIMEKDGELNKEDFVDSICEMIEQDGKLYYMPVAFGINIMTGSKENFGDMEGWSYEEMYEKYNSMPKDSMFMRNITSEWFIENIISMHIDNFIDFSTGEVNLDTEEFIKLLEFSKNFQTTEEYYETETEKDIGYMGIEELIKNNKLLLNSMYLCDFSELRYNEMLYKNHGGYNVLSYPSIDKNNRLPMGCFTGCLAISEKCDDKEGAWKFIKRLYEMEFQMKVTVDHNGFPVLKAALDKKIEDAMKITEDVKSDNSWISSSQMDENLKPYTKEQMEIFKSIVDRIGVMSDYNILFNDISEIITEETKAFYAGDKTAKETAEILQSRVKIYISENVS